MTEEIGRSALEQWLAAAMANHAEGRLEQAVMLYRAILEPVPQFAAIHSHLGAALAGLGRWDEAVASYRQAIALAPTDADLHRALGHALWALGRSDDAVGALRRAAAIAPHRPDLQADLADMCSESGLTDEAIASWRRICDLAPHDVDARVRLGQKLLKAGMAAPAVAALEQACASDPAMTEAAATLERACQLDRALDVATPAGLDTLGAFGLDLVTALAALIERALLRGRDGDARGGMAVAIERGVAARVVDLLVRRPLACYFQAADWPNLANLARLIERHSQMGILMRGVAQLHLGEGAAARESLLCASLALPPPDFSAFQAEDAAFDWDTSLPPATAYQTIYNGTWSVAGPLCPEVTPWQICTSYLRASRDPRPSLIFANMPYAGSSGVVPVLLDIFHALGWHLPPYGPQDSTRFKLLVGRREPFFLWTHMPTDLFMPYVRSPHFKFVYMHRDPRDCLNSQLNDPASPTEISDEYWSATLTYWHDIHLANGRRMIADPSLLPVTFERMKEDMPGLIGSILDFAGIDAPADIVARAIARHSFEAVTGRKRGEAGEVHRSSVMVRQGISGGWRTGLTPEQQAVMRAIIGEDVVALGYERSLDW